MGGLPNVAHDGIPSHFVLSVHRVGLSCLAFTNVVEPLPRCMFIYCPKDTN